MILQRWYFFILSLQRHERTPPNYNYMSSSNFETKISPFSWYISSISTWYTIHTVFDPVSNWCKIFRISWSRLQNQHKNWWIIWTNCHFLHLIRMHMRIIHKSTYNNWWIKWNQNFQRIKSKQTLHQSRSGSNTVCIHKNDIFLF